MGSETQAVILAAGKGVRMVSDRPKVLHSVCGQTLIERAVRAVLALEPVRIVVVVGYGADEVEQDLARLRDAGLYRGTEVVFAEQTEQRGTGHAAQMALPHLREDASEVLILPGDAPLLDHPMLEEFLHHSRSEKPVLDILSCMPPSGAAFGRIIRTSTGDVAAIVEQRDCTPEQLAIREINSSVYLSSLQLLKEALPQLRTNNAQNEFYLTDIVGYAVGKGMRVAAHCAADWIKLLGANNRHELAELERMRRDRICRHLMESGVTLEDPRAVYVDEGITVGPDTFLGAGTRLRGETVIGRGVRIDGNVWLTHATIGDHSHIKPGCVIEESQVGARCEIGPYAHLRPGSVLHDTVRIGNFVETKKAELGVGSKANHLTYLGDAIIGAGVNVGAGTITCNYDGKHKHQTIIRDRVFVGSNSCLVAPVTIGEGAYIGAGSTITKDVPDDALGIGRGRQENHGGWAAKRRARAERQS